jgi:hypothetical protein
MTIAAYDGQYPPNIVIALGLKAVFLVTTILGVTCAPFPASPAYRSQARR